MDLSTIISFFKLPKKVIFLITIISGILLFSSQQFMETISLYKFKEEYTIWIGIVFLFSLGLSIINTFEYLHNMYKTRQSKKSREVTKELDRKEYHQLLQSLDNDELANIREFYLQNKNTIEMIYSDSTVSGLVSKNIISLVSKQCWSNLYTEGQVCPFKLSNDARLYFDTYDFPKINILKRPLWINRIETSKKVGDQIMNLQDGILSSL